MEFELKDYSTSELMGKPVNTLDLGSVGRGNFTIVKKVTISELEPRQTLVNGGTLNLKMKGKHWTQPCVVVTPNSKILIDGHHTVIAKKLRGQKQVNALCYIIS
jgi:hypothetical protein